MLVWEKRHSQRLLLYKEKVQICITFMNEIRCGMPKVTAGERSHQSSGIATGTECGLSLSLVGSVLVYAADESRLFFCIFGVFFFFLVTILADRVSFDPYFKLLLSKFMQRWTFFRQGESNRKEKPPKTALFFACI